MKLIGHYWLFEPNPYENGKPMFFGKRYTNAKDAFKALDELPHYKRERAGVWKETLNYEVKRSELSREDAKLKASFKTTKQMEEEINAMTDLEALEKLFTLVLPAKNMPSVKFQIKKIREKLANSLERKEQ